VQLLNHGFAVGAIGVFIPPCCPDLADLIKVKGPEHPHFLLAVLLRNQDCVACAVVVLHGIEHVRHSRLCTASACIRIGRRCHGLADSHTESRHLRSS
jgi:hypothetical protein